MKIQERILTIEQTLANPLNTSTTKFQFSFPKAQRFRRHSRTQNSSYTFYDLPSTNNKKAPTFGSSQKCAFKVDNQNPSPDKYQLEGQFSKSKEKGIKFGPGRDELKINTFLTISNNPGPGTYSPHPEFIQSKISINYSIRKKFQTIKNKNQTPGPGTYKITSPILYEQMKLSGDKKLACPRIVKPSNRSRKLKTQDCTSLREIPQINFKGNRVTFYGSRGFSIGRSGRFSLKKPEPLPGPGAYNKFSEFIQGKI